MILFTGSTSHQTSRAALICPSAAHHNSDGCRFGRESRYGPGFIESMLPPRTSAQHRKQVLHLGSAILYLLALCAGIDAQQVPRTEELNLLGQKVVLPNAVEGRVGVLVIGFTRASKEPTSAWGKALQSQLGQVAGVEVYQVAVLEDVPRVIRGMVIAGIKSGIPDNLRSHFITVLHDEPEWKKIVQYQQPDEAYVLVLDRTGNVALRRSGPASEDNVAAIRNKVQSLLR